MGAPEVRPGGTSDLRFTYGGDPNSSASDAVRFLVGDTVRARPLLDDREVEYALSKYANPSLAAALLAEGLAARYARESDVSVGSVSHSLSQVSERFEKLALRLRQDATKMARVSFPATTRDAKKALQDDSSLTNPEFSVGLTDNPEAVQLNSELDRFGNDGIG